MNFSVKYELYRAYFERALSEHCAAMNVRPAILAESMKYSLLSGGKRIRPVLFLSTLDSLHCDYTAETALAVALECIHTYSLIHDDLPAMDNDDYRRGRLANHKMFGEANAILAGDGLLSYSFDLLLKECSRGEAHLQAARELSFAAGIEGMVAGQSADLLCTNRDEGEDTLRFIHENKTGRMITAPLVMAGTLARKNVEELRDFGEKLGLLFQITDDILDEKGGNMGKTLGKDSAEGKLTAVKVYGMCRAETLADTLAKECITALSLMEFDTSFLEGVVGLVRGRNH